MKTALQLIRTAAVSINTKIGDFTGNLATLKKYAKAAADSKTTICVTPEGSLAGYPLEDYVYFPDILTAQWDTLEEFRRFTTELAYPTIFVIGLTVEHDGMPYNCQAWVCNGDILGLIPKEELPNYYNFTDQRNYSAGFPGMYVEVNGIPMGDLVFDLPFGKVTGAICEDAWVADGPIVRRSYAGATLCAISNASDWRIGVYETRREMLCTRSGDMLTTLVSSYMVGGNAGTVYDGGSFFIQNGRNFPVIGHLEGRFQEDIWFQDFDLGRVLTARRQNTTFRHRKSVYDQGVHPVHILDYRTSSYGGEVNQPEYVFPLPWQSGAHKSYFVPDFTTRIDPRTLYMEEITEALLLGIGDFVRKTGNVNLIFASSGGKDSFMVGILIYLLVNRWFKPSDFPNREERDKRIQEFVYCYSLPTHNNSAETKSIAQQLAARAGFTFVEVSIEDLFTEGLNLTQKMVGDRTLHGLDRQNLQARLRSSLIRSVGATLQTLMIGTGNETERGRSFYTKGGDQESDLNALGGLPKSLVIAWLQYQYEQLGWEVIRDVVNSVASAELEPNQTDDDQMGPVVLNDLFLPLLLGERLGLSDILTVVRQNFTQDELLQLDPRATWEQVEIWAKNYVNSVFGGVHKTMQDPPSIKAGSIHLDPQRTNRFPIVSSGAALSHSKRQ